MIRKLFCSLTFLLLMLQCIGAEELWELNCGTETPAACQEKFKEKFSTLLHKHILNGFPEMTETLIEMVKNASSSEQQTEETIRAINDLNEQAKLTTNAKELANLLDKETVAVKTYFQQHGRVDISNQLRGKIDISVRKIFKGLASDVLKLFGGLRSEDYKEFETWRVLETKFKDELQKPNSFDADVMERLVNYLQVPL